MSESESKRESEIESESESDQIDQVTCKHLPECGMPYRGFKTEYTTLGKTTKV